ncbi:recombinase family protein [Dankookia sp. P2]|uniref:recombinase family protein n=1 Tax=Dankookia sp. P2 TaxID=3423955 RepID=UPI003D66E7BC
MPNDVQNTVLRADLPHSRAARYIAYFRVSTERQGRSGLGLDAQRMAVARHIASAGGQVVAEFQEVESGKRNDRPQLAAALAACRAHRATLLIAKLDRLARNARFLLGVVEGSGDGGVVFCDLPQVPPGPVGKFLVTQMAAVAELEAGLISQRTRAAPHRREGARCATWQSTPPPGQRRPSSCCGTSEEKCCEGTGG